MNKDVKEILNNVSKYLELKSEYTNTDLKTIFINKKYESLFDIINIFNNEVLELSEVVTYMNKFMNELKDDKFRDNIIGKLVINTYEENLVNELADVLLTSARLIHEFNLQEALSEMIEYKYERQKSRELKRFKNNE